MAHIQYKTFGQLSFADYEVFSSVPSHPFWSRVEQVIDFSFADELCASLYSSKGQRPYAPSLKLKIHFAQRYHNYSDREMEVAILYHLHI
ncbi:transposase, partial [Bacillus alkalicola]|nr:transposase [Bacillus alkalicola]